MIITLQCCQYDNYDNYEESEIAINLRRADMKEIIQEVHKFEFSIMSLRRVARCSQGANFSFFGYYLKTMRLQLTWNPEGPGKT